MGAPPELVGQTIDEQRYLDRLLMDKIVDPSAETAALLVRSGANVNASNRYGVPPLSLACATGNAGVYCWGFNSEGQFGNSTTYPSDAPVQVGPPAQVIDTLMRLEKEYPGLERVPVSHPMGGGEGRTAGGRHPCSPTGVLAKGGKTRKKRKPSNSAIIRRRRPGPHYANP